MCVRFGQFLRMSLRTSRNIPRKNHFISSSQGFFRVFWMRQEGFLGKPLNVSEQEVAEEEAAEEGDWAKVDPVEGGNDHSGRR